MVALYFYLLSNIVKIALIVLLLSSCSNLHPSQRWSEDIPPRDIFIDYYTRDQAHQQVLDQEGYLTWVHRFYWGWELYPRGWLQTTAEIIATLEAAEKRHKAQQKLKEMGRLVASEWAKNRHYRVINTRHLSIWGNALNESVICQQQLKTIDQILGDIKGLLAKQIRPQEIAYKRYYKLRAFGDDFE